MVKTIGNPLSWTAQHLGAAFGHATASVNTLGGDPQERRATRIEINEIGTEDVRAALARGWADFTACRGDVIFICLLYPVIGLILAGFGLNLDLLPLLFPLAAGFALLGPMAAVGLYEISRRRERGEEASWGSAFAVLGSPSFAAILLLGLYLLAVFLVWMLAANAIYQLTLGPEPPASVGAFLSATFTTGAGWAMILAGFAVGFVFAAVVLVMSVVSFPLLLDRDVGVPRAIATSVEVSRRNPRTVALWGAIVAAGLAVGSLPALIGLVIVMPVLGHATWHLYRRAVTVHSN